MKEKFENQYLNNKIEPINQDQDREKALSLSRYDQFGEHSYSEEKNKFEFQLGDTKISLGYCSVDFLKALPHLKSDLEDLEDKSIFDNVRLLTSLIIKNGEGNFNVKKLFPSGKIYFNLPSFDEDGSSIDVSKKNIFLERDPLTPQGLLTLLHELGHYQDYQKKAQVDEFAADRVGRDEETLRLYAHNDRVMPELEQAGAGLLEDERNAWAYALKNLKPFVGDFRYNLDGLDNLIHSNCLQSYSDHIRKQLTTTRELKVE